MLQLIGSLFVSWNTASNGMLRGCIGTFLPQPLETALKRYACEAAFNDKRFKPVSATELPGLVCSVSLLGDFEECKDYLDWDLGVHGVSVQLPTQDRVYSATFLPEVALNQGWSKRETIEYALRKAGWHQKISEDLLAYIRVQRYRSDKRSATWKDYVGDDR